MSFKEMRNNGFGYTDFEDNPYVPYRAGSIGYSHCEQPRRTQLREYYKRQIKEMPRGLKNLLTPEGVKQWEEKQLKEVKAKYKKESGIGNTTVVTVTRL